MEDHKSETTESKKTKSSNNSAIKFIRLAIIVAIIGILGFVVFGRNDKKNNNNDSSTNTVTSDKTFGTDVQKDYENLCDKFTKSDASDVLGGELIDNLQNFSSQFSTSSIDLSCNYTSKVGDNNNTLYLGVRIYPDMAIAKPLFDEDKKTAINAEDIDKGFYDPQSRKATILTDKYWLTAQINTNEENVKDKVVDAVKKLESKY